jgi:hypothetical protein
MADTRLFKITGTPRADPRYGNRVTASGVASAWKGWLYKGWIKIYATNHEATEGWTDVTEEFKARFPVG